jgi:hypothetical protein
MTINNDLQQNNVILPENKTPEKKTYRLSRNFKTTPSDVKFRKAELFFKSATALTLGFLPFLVMAIAMPIFKAFAFIGSCLENGAEGKSKGAARALKFLSALNAIPAIINAAFMMGAIKVFSCTQKMVWGKFAAAPTGDKLNTRAAQYGSTNLPGQDLKCIAKALFKPQELAKDDWKLSEWKQIRI